MRSPALIPSCWAAMLRGLLTSGLSLVLLVLVASLPLLALVRAGLTLLHAPADAAVALDWQRWGVLLLNTTHVVGVATAVTAGVGGVAGWLLARTNLPGRRELLLLAGLLACIPLYTALTFVIALIPVSRLHGSVTACGVLYGLAALPLTVLIFTLAFARVDRELEEQAALDTGWWGVLRQATWPQVTWAVGAAAVLVLWRVGTDFTISDILAIRTFAEEVFTQFSLRHSPAGPTLTGFPMLLILLGVLLAAQWRLRSAGAVPLVSSGRGPRRYDLGGWRWPLALLLGVLTAAVLIPPVRALLRPIESLKAFSDTALTLYPEVLNSAGVMLAAAAVIVVGGFDTAWRVVRGRRGRIVVGFALALALAAPSPILVITLTDLFNRPGVLGQLYDAPAILVVAHVARFLPLGVLLLVPAMRRTPLALQDAAVVDGCDHARVLWHVYWPAARGDALLAFLVCALLSYGDVATVHLLAPPGWETAAIRAFTLMHFGLYRDLAVLTIASVAVIGAGWLLVAAVVRRRFAEQG